MGQLKTDATRRMYVKIKQIINKTMAMARGKAVGKQKNALVKPRFRPGHICDQNIYRKYTGSVCGHKRKSWRWWIELGSFYALTESARQPLTEAILFNLAGPEIKKRKNKGKRRRKRKYVRRLHNNRRTSKMARRW